MFRFTKTRCFLFCVGCSFFSVFTQAQDLKQEQDAVEQVEVRSLSGSSPALVSCEISDKGRLRCVADSDLVEVSCKAGFSSNQEQSPRSVKLQGRSFVCDTAPNPEFLSDVWHIELRDRKLFRRSLWMVKTATSHQMKQAFRAELRAQRFLSTPFFSFLELGTWGSLSVNERMTLMGVNANVGLARSLSVLTEVARQIGSLEERFDYDLGLKKTWGSGGTRFFSEFGKFWTPQGTSYSSPVLTGWKLGLGLSEGSIGAFFLPGLEGWIRVESSWPTVDILRQSWRSDLGFQVPVWKKLSLNSQIGFIRQLWTSGQIRHDLSGFEVLLGVSTRVF